MYINMMFGKLVGSTKTTLVHIVSNKYCTSPGQMQFFSETVKLNLNYRKQMYEIPNKISPLKIQNLKSLMGFLEKPENKKFYEDLFMANSTNHITEKDEVPDIDKDDNSSGCED